MTDHDLPVSTPEYERWTTRAVRRPEDVRTEHGGPVPLSWQAERLQHHRDRLERGDAADALAATALATALRRDLEIERTHTARTAAELGATWAEIGAALDTTPDEARSLVRTWADRQHRLHQSDVSAGRRPLGIDPDRYAALIALTERGDDDRTGHHAH